MKLSLALLSVASLAFCVSVAAQSTQPKPVSKKTPSKPSAAAAKSSSTPVKPAEPAKPLYPEFTITELISEDANRWSDRMDTRASVSGFVTQVEKTPEGDTAIRICENQDRRHGSQPLCHRQVHSQDSLRRSAHRQA